MGQNNLGNVVVVCKSRWRCPPRNTFLPIAGSYYRLRNNRIFRKEFAKCDPIEIYDVNQPPLLST